MTTKEIQILVGKMQVLKFHNPVCENVKYLFSDWESDVVSVSKKGFVYEFEIKISRSDFFSDLKKKTKKHFLFSSKVGNTPNYFSYVCPEDMIKPEEIPSYAGLYYCEGQFIKEIVKPKIIHKTIKDKQQIFEKVCRVYSERTFLGKCRLTYENDLIKTKNAYMLRS